jgi:ADP-heptose:LPS heptosyltransferase
MNIAIVQMASFGDVVLTTCILRAIREHRPKWKIHFYTSSFCAGAVENNPDIDELHIKDMSRAEAFNNWGYVTEEAKKKHNRVLVPWPGILHQREWRLMKGHLGNNNFMWAYPRCIQYLNLPFTGKIKTYLYPTDEEKQKVSDFVASLDPRRMLMMEVSGKSGQTWWNHSWTQRAVETIAKKLPEFHLFISCGGEEPADLQALRNKYKGKQTIHYMNDFSIREMSVLFNSCDTMFSVSSGTANACMTHECKRDVKWFELVNNTCWDSSPMGNMKRKFICHKNDQVGYFAYIAKQL